MNTLTLRKFSWKKKKKTISTYMHLDEEENVRFKYDIKWIRQQVLAYHRSTNCLSSILIKTCHSPATNIAWTDHLWNKKKNLSNLSSSTDSASSFCWWRAPPCWASHRHLVSITASRHSTMLPPRSRLLSITESPSSSQRWVSRPYHCTPRNYMW